MMKSTVVLPLILFTRWVLKKITQPSRQQQFCRLLFQDGRRMRYCSWAIPLPSSEVMPVTPPTRAFCCWNWKTTYLMFLVVWLICCGTLCAHWGGGRVNVVLKNWSETKKRVMTIAIRVNKINNTETVTPFSLREETKTMLSCVSCVKILNGTFKPIRPLVF